MDTILKSNLTDKQMELLSELRGISKVILLDGIIDEDEQVFLSDWLSENHSLEEIPLISDFIDLLNDVLDNGQMNQSEQLRMFEFLDTFANGPEVKLQTDTIFTNEPTIIFNGSTFTFTGDMEYSNRDSMFDAVINLGGKLNAGNALTMKTDYLVVGSLGSDEWRYGNYGTKIEKAMRYNKTGNCKISIIQERDFVKSLLDARKPNA